MGSKIEITDDFRNLVENLRVNYKGSSFNPFKFHKDVNGTQVPVYFIGTPGLYVAIVATIISVLLMVLFRYQVSFWVWIVALIFAAFFLRVALKIDKARQIRFFCHDMLIRAYNLMNRYNESNDVSVLGEIKKYFEEAVKYLQDEVVERQKGILDKYINEKGI